MTQSIYAGDDTRLEFAIADRDGSPLYLDTVERISWALAINAHREPLLEAEYSSGGTDDGLEVIDVDGRFDVVLEPEDTRDLGGQEYYHEVEIVDMDSETSTVFAGSLQIERTIINGDSA